MDKPAVDDTNRVMPRDVALQALIDVTDVLDEFGCIHWLSDGTLLGAIRENDFIAHDYDIDLGIWASSFNPAAIHKLIDGYGFELIRMWGQPEAGLLLTVGREGIHIDLFFYYPRGADRMYYSVYKLITPNKAKRIDGEYPVIGDCVRRTFLGHDFWVPDNAEEHLIAQYGPDWGLPNPTWDFLTDPQNLTFPGVVRHLTEDLPTIRAYLGLEDHTA